MYFEQAYKKTIKNEGYYANNPLDKGGETFCGISRKFHPDWTGWIIIDSYPDKRDLKHDKILMGSVRLFYKYNYWDSNNLGEIDYELLSSKLFDIAVNCGNVIAGKMFQRALNFLGANLKVDGVIGNKTIAAYKKLCTKDKVYCLETVSGLQIAYYVSITEKNPEQRYWSRIWIGRV